MSLRTIARWRLPIWIWGIAMLLMLFGHLFRIEYDEGLASFAFYVFAGILTLPFRFLVPVFGSEGLLAGIAMFVSGAAFYFTLDWLFVRLTQPPRGPDHVKPVPGQPTSRA